MLISNFRWCRNKYNRISTKSKPVNRITKTCIFWCILLGRDSSLENSTISAQHVNGCSKLSINTQELWKYFFHSYLESLKWFCKVSKRFEIFMKSIWQAEKNINKSKFTLILLALLLTNSCKATIFKSHKSCFLKLAPSSVV